MVSPLTIAGYETLALLGSGQYGDVHLVRRKRDSQLFAAKVSNHARGVNALQLAQAKQEAELLKRMRHVNITQWVETAEDERQSGQLAIIMEYASGGDLDLYLRSYQDRHNILLDANGIVKVSDFGVSRMLQNTLDAAQTVVGTPYYMSPELMDNQPYDSKSDVWSLGCVVFELATFTPPFNGKAIGAVVYQILNAEPVPLPPCYSRPFQDMVTTLLTKDPQMRPGMKDVLRSDFVLQHMFQLMSVATFQQPKCLERFASGKPTEIQYTGGVSQPASKPQHQPVAAVATPFSLSQQAADPCDHRVQHHQVQHQQLQQQLQLQKPQSLAHLQQLQPRGGGDSARQIFFENQAAARRNKERVDKEKSAPAAFTEEGASDRHDRHYRERQAQQPQQLFPAAPQKQQAQQDPQAAFDHARQCFLENARVAKINKQRALDAMRGYYSDAFPVSPLDPGSGEPFDSFGRMAAPPPPPAPPIQQGAGRKERSSVSSYEEMLEAERRRVRAETKALHERMRAVQIEDSIQSDAAD